MRRFAGDRLRIDPCPSIFLFSHPPILVLLACPVGPKALRSGGFAPSHSLCSFPLSRLAAAAAQLKQKMVLFRGELKASQGSTLLL